MQIGIDSFAAAPDATDHAAGVTAGDRLRRLVDEIALADEVGLDVFGIGEHHRADYLDAAPPVILAAAAARTSRITLTSAVTVLSAADPVRVYQEFATLDLLSNGRAEIVAGRGSFVDAYPLFGLDLEDYDSLFVEKLDLLLAIRAQPRVTWSGRHRPALRDQPIFPRAQRELPVWIGVGGTPESFARAGTLGLPLMVAIIGGEHRRFRPLVDLYREAGRRAGHPPERLRLGVHSIGFVGDTTAGAADTYWPGYEAAFTKIGRERGWPPPTRRAFDAQRGEGGAFLVGDPELVAAKLARLDDDLGGVDRVTFQMTVASMPHAAMLRSIELLGREVAPRVRAARGVTDRS